MSNAAQSATTAPSTDSAGAHGARGKTLPLAFMALGVVYGDIGTSPLYALRESLAPGHGVEFSRDSLFGVLSLIFWSLTLVVTAKYLAFVMRADNHGEGGIFALFSLLPRKLQSPTAKGLGPMGILALVGTAMLYGDGAITPAISVLSAVEGLEVAAPALTPFVVPITCAILAGLFLLQKRGTAGIGRLFAPIMVLWFGTLAVLGAMHLVRRPDVLASLSPVYAVRFFQSHGFHGFAILGSVVLAVTGGEALYADMGHFGARPIRLAWIVFVMPALMLAYLGQGALLLQRPEAISSPFFALVPRGPLTTALVILAAAATVIASQALISGAFSLTRQAMQLGYFPQVTVCHTSSETEGQIYIREINWLLAGLCLILVLSFRASSGLAAAYGIAVTATMAVTSVLFYFVARTTWGWSRAKALPLLIFFLLLDLPFFGANLLKFGHGGYVPVLIGAGFFAVMAIWRRGDALLLAYNVRCPRVDVLADHLTKQPIVRIPGEAVFMSEHPDHVPPTLVHHVRRTKVLHDTVVLLHVTTEQVPVVEEQRWSVRALGEGLYQVVIRYGFMEAPRVHDVLRQIVEAGALRLNLPELTYFFGRRSFVATKRGQMGPVAETCYGILKRNAREADHHFGVPPENVIELGTRLDL